MYESEIRIQYPSAGFARSVKDALAPDDRTTTGTVRVRSIVKGRTLSVVVEGANRIETMQATVQDVFRCINAAETSLRKLAD
jgi:tRNA threonylcarbamoyladenosine modification (KEOPS) complex  Pcc1 subunit